MKIKMESVFLFFRILPAILAMVGIGIRQLKSRTPVGFYTGTEPPKPEEIRDIPAYNKRHGWMWIGFGLGMLVCWLAGAITGDDWVFTIFFLTEVFGGLVLMMLLHHKWLKQYKVEPPEKEM